MTDNAVLAIKTLADDLRIRRRGRSSTTTSPIHNITLIDILSKSTTMEGEIKAPPEEHQDKDADKPRREWMMGI
jgi:hypothetical protein